MPLHLLHGKRGILFDIFIIGCIPALRLRKHGDEQAYQKSCQSERMFHGLYLEFGTKVHKRIEKTNLFPIFVTLITI